jgi:ubiquinone/menaquinone biosynthesis C-methylase UbiE
VSSTRAARSTSAPATAATLSGWRCRAGPSRRYLSTVALERAAERAAARGTQIECVVADWREHGFGDSAFDLVVVSFMHPDPTEREALFARVGRALAPGDHVFTVGVVLADHGRRGPPDAERLYTPDRVRRALGGFEVLRCEEHSYEQEHSSVRRQVTDVVAIGRRPSR